MKRTFILLVSLFLFVGCAKLKYMQQLLTIKAMSEEGDRQESYVKDQDKKFDELLEKIQLQQMDQYQDQKSILNEFGKPVIEKEVVKKGIPLSKWLYRYQTNYFNSDKVYFYFDQDAQLVDWEYVRR